jgi:hypothetical protein
MHQAIHIFWKDARRSWIYIAAVWSLVLASPVLTPRWEGPGSEAELPIGVAAHVDTGCVVVHHRPPDSR